MTFPLVVGITGFAQNGKDTFAARLVDRHGFKRYAFADPLKSLALTLDPLIPFGAVPADNPGPRGYQARRLSFVVRTHGWEFAKQEPEVRRFLQVLGTEGVRHHLGDDSWVKACGKAFLADGVDRVVITDVRFPNEADYVRNVCGGVLVRVTRWDWVKAALPPHGTVRARFDNGLGTDHPSEQHIATLPVDFEVDNDGDVTDLCRKADALALDIEEGFGRGARLSDGAWRASLDDPYELPTTTAYENEVHEALQRRYQGPGR